MDAIHRAVDGAQTATDAPFLAILIAIQKMTSAVTIRHHPFLFRVLEGNRFRQHIFESYAHPNQQVVRTFNHSLYHKITSGG
jgi:hypothetical protein